MVGLAESLLDTKFGDEIDQHDTVVRMGFAPTSEYRERVGSKTDVVIVRMHSK